MAKQIVALDVLTGILQKVYAKAKKYTDDQIAIELLGLNSSIGANSEKIAALQTTTGELSSSVATLQSKLGTAESNIEELQNIVLNVYTIKGSIAFENLPTEINIGWVYNISNDFITTDNFIEGAGIQCKAGTNIVAVNIGTNETPIKKWDILSVGASIDYATTEDIKNIFGGK